MIPAAFDAVATAECSLPQIQRQAAADVSCGIACQVSA